MAAWRNLASLAIVSVSFLATQLSPTPSPTSSAKTSAPAIATASGCALKLAGEWHVQRDDKTVPIKVAAAGSHDFAERACCCWQPACPSRRPLLHRGPRHDHHRQPGGRALAAGRPSAHYCCPPQGPARQLLPRRPAHPRAARNPRAPRHAAPGRPVARQGRRGRRHLDPAESRRPVPLLAGRPDRAGPELQACPRGRRRRADRRDRIGQRHQRRRDVADHRRGDGHLQPEAEATRLPGLEAEGDAATRAPPAPRPPSRRTGRFRARSWTRSRRRFPTSR